MAVGGELREGHARARATLRRARRGVVTPSVSFLSSYVPASTLLVADALREPLERPGERDLARPLLFPCIDPSAYQELPIFAPSRAPYFQRGGPAAEPVAASVKNLPLYSFEVPACARASA